jgi:ATP-dependent RNA helicase DDX23/PRP28
MRDNVNGHKASHTTSRTDDSFSRSHKSSRDTDYSYNGRDGHEEENRHEQKKKLEESTADPEIGSMKARYMGIAPPKIKKRRLNDRKFVFDWSTDADTSNTSSTPVQTGNIAFGRGHFGGLDSGNGSRRGLDRHWSEKELIEMTERDWRIFREDYNIATKGFFFLYED